MDYRFSPKTIKWIAKMHKSDSQLHLKIWLVEVWKWMCLNFLILAKTEMKILNYEKVKSKSRFSIFYFLVPQIKLFFFSKVRSFSKKPCFDSNSKRKEKSGTENTFYFKKWKNTRVVLSINVSTRLIPLVFTFILINKKSII